MHGTAAAGTFQKFRHGWRLKASIDNAGAAAMVAAADSLIGAQFSGEAEIRFTRLR
jgi:hypothetical protein